MTQELWRVGGGYAMAALTPLAAAEPPDGYLQARGIAETSPSCHVDSSATSLTGVFLRGGGDVPPTRAV